MKQYIIRRVERDDLEQCAQLEQTCFSPFEAADKDFINKRIEIYPDGFYVAEIHGKIVGMINTGATHKEDISDEQLKKLIGHVRNGKNGVIFSLAVHPDYRGKGIAKSMISQIIEVLQRKEKQNILLLCRDNLVDFYNRLGFHYDKASSSTYGGIKWHEMSYPLSA